MNNKNETMATFNQMLHEEYREPSGCGWMVIMVVIGVTALALFGCTKTDIHPDNFPDITEATICATLKSDGPNRLPNGGGEGTTDWLGATNARGWGSYPTDRLTRFSIGQSGTDRYQEVSSPSQFCLISPTPAPVSGVWNTLRFRYTATTPFIVVVRYSDRCGYRIAEGMVSHEWEYVCVTFWAPKVVSVMWYNRPEEPGELRIDNVNLN